MVLHPSPPCGICLESFGSVGLRAHNKVLGQSQQLERDFLFMLEPVADSVKSESETSGETGERGNESRRPDSRYYVDSTVMGL